MAKQQRFISKHPQWYSDTMTPDPMFMRQLKDIDSAFYPRWCWLREHWEIWYRRAHRPTVLAMVVQNEDGSYRPLDQRTIEKVNAGDSHRYQRKQDMLHEIESREAREKEIREKDHRAEIHGITTEFSGYMRGVVQAQVPAQIA